MFFFGVFINLVLSILFASELIDLEVLPHILYLKLNPAVISLVS